MASTASDLGTGLVTILLAIVGIALVAVLVSNSANTANVLSAGGTGIANAIKCAVSPVTGGSCQSSVVSAVTSVFHPLTQESAEE